MGNLTLVEASKDVGLEINAENTKCVIISRHPISRQNQNIRIANISFEKCGKIQIIVDYTNKSE
jgi:hypothetical protein